MPFYENVFIARQDVSSQQVDAMIEEFTKLISENGGEVPKTEYWGVRGLAYRIKKNRKGHYVLMNIETQPDSMLELERQMRLHEDIIRYLTVRVDKLEEGQSVMMQSRGRSGRSERSERVDKERDEQPSIGGKTMEAQAENTEEGKE